MTMSEDSTSHQSSNTTDGTFTTKDQGGGRSDASREITVTVTLPAPSTMTSVASNVLGAISGEMRSALSAITRKA